MLKQKCDPYFTSLKERREKKERNKNAVEFDLMPENWLGLRLI